MKIFDKHRSGDQSCSCTSCTYRTESDRPSLKRIISQGNRIDRLYYGQYIPLREKKLLDKLVRTRAVYDDIRAKILSDSTLSLDNKAVLKPQRKLSRKNLDDALKNKAVLEFVDLVDKGETLESKDLSGCCSCCSCYSKINLHHKPIGKQRRKRAAHTVNRHGHSRRNVGEKSRTKGGVRFKAKHIWSDPCTCAYKLSGMFKNLTKGSPLVDLQPSTDEEINHRFQKNRNLARLSHENLQIYKSRVKDVLAEGIRKISDSKTNIQEKIDEHAKKSLEKLKKGKDNVKHKLSTQKKKGESPKNYDLASCMCPEIDLAARIKKDSISKFKDDLKRKQLRKMWECESRCVEDICFPEECYYQIKNKHSRYLKRKGYKNEIVMKEKKIGVLLNQPQIKISSKKIPATTIEQTPKLRARKTGKIVKTDLIPTKVKDRKRQKLNVKGEYVKFGTTAEDNCNCSTPPKKIRNQILHISRPGDKNNTIYQQAKNLTPERRISQRQAVRIGSSFTFNIEFYKNIGKSDDEKSNIKLPHSTPTQLIKLTNKAPEKKKKIKVKDSKTGESHWTHCFCTRKMKCKKNNIKIPSKTKNNKSLMTLKSVNIPCTDRDCAIDNWCEKLEFKRKNPKLTNVDKNTYYRKRRKSLKSKQSLLSYECEPGVCDPDTCCPYQCLEIINLRKGKSKAHSVQCPCPRKMARSSQSSSTLTSKSCAPLCVKPKGVKSMITEKSYKKHKLKNPKPRQAVRIGSTFSFNLEFYKDRSPSNFEPNNLISITSKPHLKAIRNKNNAEDRIMTKLKYKKAGFGSTLKRCFCTLKIQEKKPIKPKKQKMLSTGTNALDNNYSRDIVLYNKSTKTKKSFSIPGECDPYECLERMNRHYLKEMASITEPEETKDVSSTTYSKKSLKTIHVQSKPKFRNKASVKTKKIKVSDEFKEYSSIDNTKQAVKIGSSFSFGIEFFKNTNLGTVNLSSQLGKKRKSKKNTSRGNKINKLNVAYVTTQVKREKALNKASMAENFVKRCFCTLNLQKYYNHQNTLLPPGFVYTVNRAMTETSPIVIFKKNSNGCKFNSNLLPISHCHKYSMQKYPILLSTTEEQLQSCTSLTSDISWKSSITFFKNNVISISNLQQTDITNLSQYVRNCFCTMNFQLASKNGPNKKPKSGNTCVRLGSSFTFDIDFCKNSLQARKKNETTSETEVNNKFNKIRREPKNKVANHNRQSQSVLNEMTHKASATAAIPRRCFCTLQLQKKGRRPRKKKEPHKVSNPSINKVKSVSKAQNTKFKQFNIAHSLKPYECEPGICNPDHCDPYQCLEIMKGKKHTKETGIHTILQPKKSVSSITSENESKGTQKRYTRKQKTRQITSDLKESEISGESHILQPSKQVVRVGSNFSFNIEFCKEKDTPVTRRRILGEVKKTNQTKRKKEVIDTSQNSKLMRHKETDIKKSPRVASTMTTSFLKRCFCTAKLKEPKRNVKLNLPKDVASTTFREKCTCFLQSIKSSFIAANQGINLKKAENVSKKTNTQNSQNKQIVNKPPLEPYECEPGICIPGECDPYVCEEIMKKNKMKRKSQLSNTETSKSHSAFTHTTTKGAKNVRTQLKLKDRVKHTQHKQKNVKSKTPMKATDKQVVKIGSHFSFNIEFYKNKMPSSDTNIRPRKLHSFSAENKKAVAKKVKTETVSNRPRMTQIIPAKQKDSAIDETHNLKRCFCTLQLHNRHSKHEVKFIEKKRNQGVKLRTKSVMTKTDKRLIQNLKYYECEPGICVPNQCDPYECEKIMKLKRKDHELKEFGIETESPRKYSASSSTSCRKISKGKTQTMVDKKYEKKVSYDNKNKNALQKQKVKIGSSFNFKIEFFKDRNNPGFLINNKHPEPTKSEHGSQQTRGYGEREPLKNKEVQWSKLNKKTARSQATMIKVPPGLKRCFCTLLLKKGKKKNQASVKQRTFNVGTETTKPREQKTLLPYECEPLTCVPGECNPVECLQRIKTRQYKNFGGSTKAEKRYSARTMTNDKTKIKTVKNQIKSVDKTKKREIESVDRLNKDFHKNESNLSKERKQAVRIGSNFSFNVEFYKDRRMRNDKKYKEKSEPKKPHTGTSKLRNIETNKQKNMKTGKENNNIKAKVQSSSLLKKCFCVLKLHKMRNTKQKHITPRMNNATTKLQVKYTENVNTATQYKLLPYECEPNVCIPGKCDPYECEKRIKNRISKKTGNDLRKSKTAATRRIKSKSVKLQGPKVKLRDRQQNKTYKQNVNKNQNGKQNLKASEMGESKQVVRIGSKFCFDIEILKNQYSTSTVSTDRTVKREQRVRKRKNDDIKITKHNKKVHTKKQAKVTRGLSPFECLPFSCNPENCDPYECEKKLQQRRKQSHSISTQMLKQYSNEGVGEDDLKKDECSITETATTSPRKTQIDQKIGIVKVPKYDKQLVKVGSNFSFNIEFYKERGQKHSKLQKTMAYKDSKKIIDAKSIHTKPAIKHNYESQAAINTDNKALEVHNTLKRCFCTLKLQKNDDPININKSKMPQFPRTFEVRRVAVQQTHEKVKSVATRINQKYMKETTNCTQPCHCCEHKNDSFRRDPKTRLQMNCMEMQTILPYAPTKFKKTTSKTMLLEKNKFQQNKMNKTNNGNKLKKKKSLRNINCDKQLCKKNALKKRNNFKMLKKFACACVSLLSRKKDNLKIIENRNIKMNKSHEIDTRLLKQTKNLNHNQVKGSKSYRKPLKLAKNANSEVDKSKSQKFDGKYGNGTFLQFEDYEKSPSVRLRVQKRNGKVSQSSKSMKQIPKPDLYSKSQQRQTKNNDIRICDHCETKLRGRPMSGKGGSSPPKVHFFDTYKNTSFDKKSNIKKQLKQHRKCKRLHQDGECCYSCGQTLNKEELKKGSGDRPADELNKNMLRRNTINKIKSIFKPNKDVSDVSISNTVHKPLFEMQIRSDDYYVINKKEVLDNVIKLSNKKVNDYESSDKFHEKSCRCCICKSKKNKVGNSIDAEPKGLKAMKRYDEIPYSPKSKSYPTAGNKRKTKVINEQSEKHNIVDLPKTICSDKNLNFKKKLKHNRKSKRLLEEGLCCYSCGQTLNKEKLKKGSSDLNVDKLTKNDLRQNTINKIKNIFKPNHYISDASKSNSAHKPLFEMQISSDDYDVINKKEVFNNVIKFSTKKVNDYDSLDKFHEKSCRCCICKSKKNKMGASIDAEPQVLKTMKRYDDIPHSQKSKSAAGNKRKTKLINKQSDKHNIVDISRNIRSDKNLKFKKQLKHKESKRLPEEGKCCCCGQTLNKEKRNKTDMCQNTANKIKSIIKLITDTAKASKVCTKKTSQKPLFEMQIASNDYDIINKKEVFDSVIKLSTKKGNDYNRLTKSHKKSCRCCICVSKKNKVLAHIKKAGVKGTNLRKRFGNIFSAGRKKPCICGSKICKTQSRRKIKLSQVQLRPPPCKCGSPVCRKESANIKVRKRLTKKKKIGKKKKENKKKKAKTEAKLRKARLKEYDKEDRRRKQKRRKEYRLMEKKIDKTASDAVLLTESAIDIGKLGITAGTDILRSVARIAIDPKHAVKTLKSIQDDPRLIARYIKAGFSDSGVASTARRIRLRCMAMQGVKKIKALLAGYAITRYLMYIGDKDPKRRMRKPKVDREREQLDFGCSLYMGSLRKKPYLSVYNRFPHLYPHFLSLLNVWKQFTDIMLFLLAVVVWSPCILCTEFCRAMTCCFFCTG